MRSSGAGRLCIENEYCAPLFGNNGFGTVWNGLTKPNELYRFSPLKRHLQNGGSRRSLLCWCHKEDWHMKRKYCTLYLSEDEYSVTLDALIRLKNKLIRQGRYADIVDEVILLLVDAKIKRVRIWKLHRRSHTVFTFKTVWLFSYPHALHSCPIFSGG